MRRGRVGEQDERQGGDMSAEMAISLHSTYCDDYGAATASLRACEIQPLLGIAPSSLCAA
jgi:hypothetical protein